MTKTFEPIPRFNDHGAGCKGHLNWMLDCTMEKQEEREIMIKSIENYIGK